MCVVKAGCSVNCVNCVQDYGLHLASVATSEDNDESSLSSAFALAQTIDLSIRATEQADAPVVRPIMK